MTATLRHKARKRAFSALLLMIGNRVLLTKIGQMCKLCERLNVASLPCVLKDS
jgi:hypothetical protein